MDLFEILLQRDINDVRRELERHRLENDLAGWDVRKLVEENAELKLRLGLLVRLLIARGVFTAEEYAGLMAGARRGQ
jgi:hypothetical protein